MVERNTPLAIWVQLSSFCFFMSGLFADLLVIRLFLCAAYSFLLINAALGAPLWPDASQPGYISLDGIIWSILNLYVHGCAAICLLHDEAKVTLTDDEEALWRFLYRSGGFSRKLFKQLISKRLNVVEYQPGDAIPTDEHFYIVYKGLVTLDVLEEESEKVRFTRTTSSGGMFDLKDLDLLSERVGFQKNKVYAVSKTQSKLFQFTKENIKEITHEPFAKGVWQSLLIESLGKIIERGDCQQAAEEQVVPGEEYVDPIFHPLESWEEPSPMYRSGTGAALKKPFHHLWYSVTSSLAPPWPLGGHPVGIRHTLLPAPSHHFLTKQGLHSSLGEEQPSTEVSKSSMDVNQ